MTDNKKDNYQIWLDKYHIELQNKFIEEVISYVGEDYYDFSQVNYINKLAPVKLIVKETGEIIEKEPAYLLDYLKRKKKSEDKRIQKEKEFIKKLEEKFGENRFNFSLLYYVNTTIPIKLICNVCGEVIEDIPHLILNYKEPCLSCRNSNSIWNTEKFIKHLEDTYGKGYYDYSNINYVNSSTKVLIICPKHGEQWVKPASLTVNVNRLKYPCPKCSIENRESPLKLTTEEFIRRAKEIHGDKYDYSKTVYKSSSEDVTIFCKQCQEYFIVNAGLHLRGVGCNIHNGPKIYDTETFIKASKEKFGENAFDYSLVNYIDKDTPIKLICKEHGIVEITPRNHLESKTGCTYCGYGYIPSGPNNSLSKEEFIRRARLVHGDTYDYSEIKYVNNKTLIKIYCKECKEYFWQTPNDHLNDHGCPNCKLSLGERRIKNFLILNNIEYIPQKIYEDLKDTDYLKFDFYLPDYNLCIEYQGIQHYIPQPYFGGKEAFKKLQYHDQMKRDYCRKNNIDLLEIKYTIKSIKSIENRLAEYLNLCNPKFSIY